MKTLVEYINEKYNAEAEWGNDAMWKNAGKKKGLTIGGTIWKMMYDIQEKGYGYADKLQKYLEKTFPKIDEWVTTTPNTGKFEIKAMKDGKEVAKLHVTNYDDNKDKSHTVHHPTIQNFLDKLNEI